MLKDKKIFFIIICIIVMAVFSYSYIRAYNTEIKNRFIGESKNYSVLSSDDTVKTDATIVMEIFDTYTDDIYETNFEHRDELYGKTREELNLYIESMNESISEDEKESGLLNYQLVYYSPSYVTIRKNYDTSSNVEQYLLKNENGYIVVYKYPDNEFYHNTGIMTLSIDDETRKSIDSGDLILNIEELYDFLESHSS